MADYEDDESVLAYASEDCYVISIPGRRKMRFLVLPKKDRFDLQALEDFVNKRSDNFTMQINLDEGEASSLRFNEPYETHGPIYSLYAAELPEDSGERTAGGDIRKLNKSDGRLVRRFEQEDGQMMSLDRIFPLLVVDEIGSILAYFNENNQLVAYASYMPTEFKAAAVDEIYVLPEFRGQGIGTTLALAMLEAALDEYGACYWPVAESDEAVSTAEAAGFRQVAERMTAETF